MQRLTADSLVLLCLASRALGANQCGWNPSSISALERSPGCPLLLDESVGSSPSSWSPWTHQPYCAGSPYCIFTNAMMPARDGISILTTPELAASGTSPFQHVFDAPFPDRSKVSNNNEPLYEIKEVQGKGKGAIATRRIAKDMVIMIDPAIMLSPMQYPGDVPWQKIQDMLRVGVEQLRDPERVTGLGKKGTSGASPVEDVFLTNSFAVSVGGALYSGLFPELSRLNHDCRPNARIYFSEKAMTMVVWSLRDIEPGEEITISCNNPNLHTGFTYQERQRTTADLWGFHCNCPLCSVNPEARAISDERRTSIRVLRAEIVQAINSGNLTRALEIDEELIDLVSKEDMTPHYRDYFQISAQLYNVVGNLDKAEEYVKIVLEELQRYGWPGPEEETTIDKFKRLLQSIEGRRRN
ncbi:SET domain-containing protein [Thozetella sp. PMI_491]|nr:SET domain-containing protein [Thozetella sp. PMI_491]